MISNVADDVEDCLQMAPFSWCFGVLKAIKSEKIKQNKTKRACIGTPRQNGARRFTTETKWIVSLPISRATELKERRKRLGEERDTEFDPADAKGSDSDSPEASVEGVNEPSTLRGVCVGGGGGSWDKE